MSSFLSPFQLQASSFESLSFEMQAPIVEGGSTSLSLGHHFDDGPWSQDNTRALQGAISVECEWQDDAGETLCKGSCIVRGLVSVGEISLGQIVAVQELDELLEANLISLLYGEARSMMETLSGCTPAGRQTLPAIDPFAYLASED